MSLFRQQAVDRFLRSGDGAALQVGRLPYRNFCLFIVFFLLCLLAFLRWGRYAQTETVTGVLIPAGGYTKVFSGSGGTAEALHVLEGDSVRRGDVLLTLRRAHSACLEPVPADGQPACYRDVNEERIAQIARLIGLQRQRIAAQEQLHRQEVQALDTAINHAQRQIRLAQAQRTQQNRDIALLHRQWSDQQALLSEAHVSRAVFDEKERELLSSRLRLSVIDKEIAGLQARLAARYGEMHSLPGRQRIRQLEAEQRLANLNIQLAEANARLGQQIRSPVAGRVSNIVYEQGNFIPPAGPVMAILPDNGPLYAELYVPTRARGFLTTGQPVLLRFHAFPYQKFGTHPARIDEISATVMVSDALPVALALNEPVYRIRASLEAPFIHAYGEAVALRPGMLLDAEIVKDRRTLIEWLFEPIVSMSKRP